MSQLKPCQPPPPLQTGDLLKVIAPSGCLIEGSTFEQGVELWRSQGYKVEFSPGLEDRWGYLAGTDEARRMQLQTAWADPHCRGILCARGGYGSMRLLEDWQWPPDLPPKWLIGFSDITALHWSLATQGISSVHGPVLTTLAAEPDWSRQRLFDWVSGVTPLPSLQGKGWGGGTVSGPLLPANLTVATHILNTPLQPELTGAILALEDVGEAPYRLDRLLTQWRLSGALQQVSGIALGRFSQCKPPASRPSFTVDEVLRDRIGDLGIPVVSDLPFGHDGANAALPVGIMATLDGDKGLLQC